MTAAIRLTQGLVALVDDDDYEIAMSRAPWYPRKCCRTVYAQCNALSPTGRHSSLTLHRLLTGWPLTDHVNGDALDNRRRNLRPATPSQNAANRRQRSDNTSGFKGVSLNTGRGKTWCAQIFVTGTRIRLGMFDDRTEAALAYDAAARDYFGEFARLNFPANDQERAA